jgi:hypothetical protein
MISPAEERTQRLPLGKIGVRSCPSVPETTASCLVLGVGKSPSIQTVSWASEVFLFRRIDIWTGRRLRRVRAPHVFASFVRARSQMSPQATLQRDRDALDREFFPWCYRRPRSRATGARRGWRRSSPMLLHVLADQEYDGLWAAISRIRIHQIVRAAGARCRCYRCWTRRLHVLADQEYAGLWAAM